MNDMSQNAPRRRKSQAADQTVSRFEFARKHIVKRQKLVELLASARNALYNWENHDENGVFIRDEVYDTRIGYKPRRKPKGPEEREHLKALKEAVIEAETYLLMHDNDGRDL